MKRSKKRKRQKANEKEITKPKAETTQPKPQEQKRNVRSAIVKTISIVGSIAGILALGWTVYRGIQPKVTATVNQSQNSVFDADFIFKNEGYTTVRIRGITMEYRVKIPDGTIIDKGDGTGILRTQFIPPVVYLGKLKPGDSTTARLVSDTTTRKVWKAIDVCFGVSYEAFPFIKRKEGFGFSTNREAGMNYWIPRPCEEAPITEKKKNKI